MTHLRLRHRRWKEATTYRCILKIIIESPKLIIVRNATWRLSQLTGRWMAKTHLYCPGRLSVVEMHHAVCVAFPLTQSR